MWDNTCVSSISGITSTLGLTPAASAPFVASGDLAHVRILSVNDFHGQLPDSPAEVDGVKIGGAATLAAYVQRERAGNPNGTFFVSAGDAVGAAPPESTLLKHHSTIAALEAMGLDLATFGNHEFDKGYAEAIRIIFGDAAYETALAAQTGVAPARKRTKGSNAQRDAVAGAASAAAAKGAKHWPGSPFPWVSANVVDAKTKKPILPPYVIREINGVKVAFVGAVTKDLKKVTVAKGIPNIEAIDPVVAINKLVPEIQAKGAKAIVVVVHEGGEADEHDPTKLHGPIVDMANKLDPEVDAIISGHSHKEYATQINGKQVVQAGNYAKALGVVELAVDRKTGQVVQGASRLVRNDEAGILPDPKVAKMVETFHAAVAPRTEKVVTTLTAPLTRVKAANGETTLGSLIADAQRTWAKTDIGLMNNGGVRQDIEQAGPLTWGTLFGVQPFGNRIMKFELTGAEVIETLEQQFNASGAAKVLQISGMTVHLDITKPVGSRVVKVVMADGTALDPKKTYTVSANSFIADGGDGYTALKKGRKVKDVGDDLEALVAYLASGKPVPTKVPGRIVVDAGTIPADSH